MSDKTGIEWTDATPMVDRQGRRVRIYQRTDSSRPGQQLRRGMLAQGKKWCRGCQQWLAANKVGKNGLCRPHENADSRRRYASDPSFRESRKAHSCLRKRGVLPVPPVGAELLAELFDGECAYCDAPFSTWDHVLPVSKGGQTIPGNIVPACLSCNSAKSDRDLETWLDRAPMVKPYTIEYLSHLGAM